jgi:hypothetical protein
MATFTKGLLSGTSSDDGQAFEVTTSHTTVHTGPTTATSYDEVWIYATNAHTADIEIYIGWGATGGTAANQIRLTITAKTGYKLVIPGLILKGNASPLIVTAYAGTTGKVNLTGYVNHITA